MSRRDQLSSELKVLRARTLMAQTKLNVVATTLDVGIILIRPDGALEYINHKAKELLVGDHPADFEARFAELRAHLPQEPIGDLCQPGGVSGIRHIELTGATGVTRRLQIECYALGTDIKGCLLIIKDRDLIDALDEDLRAATRARSLSRLYAAVAHDLKAPLNAMSLHLEMLKRSLNRSGANTVPQQMQRIETLNKELMRLNRLLHSVLDQGAPAAKHRDVIDLKRLIEELETLLMPQARHQCVELDIELPPQPVLVFGHAEQLKQALLNVILNALECLPKGGHVDISLRTDASRALIAIRDNGPGIPDALQPHIFDMHFTTKDTGTGIGLYVARAVVVSHRGEIRVESKLGAGACFHVSLPIDATKRCTDSIAASTSKASQAYDAGVIK
jgi:signal transduction histidine kinase